MNRGALIAALALCVGCPSGAKKIVKDTPPPEPEKETYEAEVKTLVGPLIDGEWVKGVSLGLIVGDDVFFYGFGHRSGKEKTAPDADTVFEIGSATKVFTSLLLADAVGRVAVNFEDPVAKLLPEGTVVPEFEGKPITLEHLATHSSGLPRMPSNFSPSDMGNPFADYTVEQMYAFLAAHKLRRAPGAEYEYSNLATGLLGHALSLQSGKDYEPLVIEQVCKPLGMTSTVVTLTDAHRENMAVGHDGEGTAVKNWDIPSLAGAGAFRSTARDMAAFVKANVLLSHRELGPAMKLTHAPRFDADAKGGRVGLAWHIEPDGIVWHNGQTGGYHSYIAFDRDARVGVVVLANTSTGLVDALGQALILMMRKKAYALELPTTVHLSEEVVSRYVGTYKMSPTFVISVVREDDKLYAQATGQPRYRLYASSERTFYLRVIDAQITFEVSESGTTTAIVLHQDGQDFRGPRL